MTNAVCYLPWFFPVHIWMAAKSALFYKISQKREANSVRYDSALVVFMSKISYRSLNKLTFAIMSE